MSVILDRGQDPGASAAVSAARGFGAAGWLAYVGGRSLFFARWSDATIQGIMQAGLGVLPVYAMATPLTQAQGTGDGSTAAQLAAGAGVPSGSLVMLDVEPSFYSGNPGGTLTYANAWQNAVQAAGYKSCMYGLANFIDAFQSTPPSADAVIVANYPRPLQIWGPPSTNSIPGALSTWPVARGWQYTNEVSVGGLTVDLSVINFTLAGEAMALDPNDPVVQQILGLLSNTTGVVDRMGNVVRFGTGAGDLGGDWGLTYLAQQLAKIDQIVTTLANLQVPPANLQPVLAAIAALKAELDTVKAKTDKDLA